MRLRLLRAILPAFLLAPLFFARYVSAQAPPSPPAVTRTTTRTVAAAFLRAEAAAVRLALEGGSGPVAAVLDADSVLLKRGRPARAAEFAANEKVMARLTFRRDGTVLVRTLYDLPSYEAYDRDRREVCVGTVGTNVAGHLQVRRANGTAVLYRVTEKSQVRKGGALAKLAVYPVGAPVAVKPRGLPSGDIWAAIVAESPAEVEITHRDGLVNWEGTVESVDVAGSRLALRRTDGAVRSVAVAPTARISRGRTQIQWKDIKPGDTVEVHLLRGADPNGLRTADAVSLITPKPGQ